MNDGRGDRAGEGSASAPWFTPADLAANRAGELSPAQRELIERLRAESAAMWRYMGPVYVFAFVGGPLSGGLAFSLDSGAVLPAVGFGAGLIATVGYCLRWLILGYRRPPKPLQLRSVEGPITLGSREGGGWGSDVPTIRIGRLTIDLPSAAVGAFPKGMAYRLYYVEEPELLVSAEPLT